MPKLSDYVIRFIAAQGVRSNASTLCLAENRRNTIWVDGDGGFPFNTHELETVAWVQLPLQFRLLNNASIRAPQESVPAPSEED